MKRRLLFPSFPGAWGPGKALRAEQGPAGAAPNLSSAVVAPPVSFTVGAPPLGMDTRGLIEGRPATGVTRRRYHPNTLTLALALALTQTQTQTLTQTLTLTLTRTHNKL